MVSMKTPARLRILAACMFVCLCALGVLAEDDPDPNSPSPILLSQVSSTRAVAVPDSDIGRVDLMKTDSRAFDPNAKVTLFVTNLTLMPSEGASAFRVYATDSLGRQYRFPVIGFASAPWRNVFAVTVRLTDEIGYWPQPQATGDLLLQLTWRGMGSNRVRLGLGQVGGGPADDDGARPTPYGTTATMRTAGKETEPGDSPDYVGYRWSGDRMRLQEQATFGPNPTIDSRIRRIGLRTWLNEQFEAGYPSQTNPYPNQVLKPGSRSARLRRRQLWRERQSN